MDAAGLPGRTGAVSPAHAPRVGWHAWLVPDLALLISFLTLFYCVFLVNGLQKLFRDSDSGWHIRIGEAILNGGGLPRTDPYSLLRAGEPWFAWEWLSDVLMGAVHMQAGLAGVALLYAVAIAGCTWLWFRLHWSVGGNFLVAAVLSIPMLTTSSIHWLARPHVFSWIFLLALLWWIERGPQTGAALPWLALGSALWANMHASFFLGPVILTVYAAAHWFSPLIWELDRLRERSRARYFGGAALLAAAAGLVNPYGWKLYAHLVRYLSDRELIDRIGEFQSFNFHAEGAFQILFTILIAGAGGMVALSQKQLAHAALSLLFVAMALRSARALPLVALLILPLANGAITSALARARGLAPRVRAACESFLAYGINLRAIDRGLGGWALAPVILAAVVLGAPAAASRAGFPEGEFPVAAAEAAAKLPENARILAPDKFGGYLIYRFDGRRKVYFDGRSDFYGSQYMKDYLRLVEVREGWQEQLRAAGFTHALLPNSYSLIPALEQIGWKRVYRDQVATLLESQ